MKARKRKMAALHAGDLVLTRTEYKYLKDHPEDALAVIGVPGIIMETFRDNFEVLIDWSLLSNNHDHRGRDRWCIDEIVKVGSLGKPGQNVMWFPEYTQEDVAALSDEELVVLLEAAGEWMGAEWDPEEKRKLAAIFQTLLDEAKKRNLSYEIPSRTIIVGQYHERKIPAGQLQVGDLFVHEGKDYVVTGIQQNGYIRSKPIPSGTVRWFAPHYKVRLVKTAQEIRTPGPTIGFHHVPREEIERMLRGLEGTFGWEGAEKTVFWEIEKATGPLTEEEIGKLKAVIQAISQEMRVAAIPGKTAEEEGIKVVRTRHHTLDGEPLPFGQVILEMSDGGVRGPMPLEEAHQMMWEIGQWGPKIETAQRVAVNIRNETRGAHHGQYDGALIATDPATGEYRGHLDYAHLEEPGEEILIQWMEVLKNSAGRASPPSWWRN